MVATIPILTDEDFSLPAWLGKITIKRRKVVVPPDNLPIKKNISKSLKGKIVSRIVVDSKKTKLTGITKPLVDKPTEELNRLDYKFTKIKLGKQSWLGCL